MTIRTANNIRLFLSGLCACAAAVSIATIIIRLRSDAIPPEEKATGPLVVLLILTTMLMISWFFDACIITYRRGYKLPGFIRHNAIEYELVRKHQLAFLAVVDTLGCRDKLGSWRVCAHDLDRLLLNRLLVPWKFVLWLHMVTSSHHRVATQDPIDMVEIAVNFEAWRITSADNVSAYTKCREYGMLSDKMLEVLKDLGIAPGCKYYRPDDAPIPEYDKAYNALLSHLGEAGDCYVNHDN